MQSSVRHDTFELVRDAETTSNSNDCNGITQDGAGGSKCVDDLLWSVIGRAAEEVKGALHLNSELFRIW